MRGCSSSSCRRVVFIQPHHHQHHHQQPRLHPVLSSRLSWPRAKRRMYGSPAFLASTSSSLSSFCLPLTPPLRPKKKKITPSLVVSLPAETHSSLAAGAEDSALDSSLRECWDGDARRLPSSHHTQQLHGMTNDCEGRGGATRHQRPESCQKTRRGDEEFSLQTKTPLCIVLASTRSLAGDRREETTWCRGLDRWRCCLTDTVFQTVGCDVHPADL